MELIASPTSPFGRKVLIIAREIGIADRIKLVTVNPRTESDKLTPLNPLSKVPALRTDDGKVLFDSAVICEYIDTEFGNNRFIPKAGPRRWEVLTVATLGDGILDAAIIMRNGRSAPPDHQAREFTSWQLQRVELALDRLDSIVDTFGDAPDLRHVATACAFGYLQFRFSADGFLTRRPKLDSWYAGILKRPSFGQTVPVE